jgi:hypothetical protein
MPVDGQTINARFLQAVTTKLLIWQKKNSLPILPLILTFTGNVPKLCLNRKLFSRLTTTPLL